MAILVTVNGNNSGEGFLIAPFGGRTFPVPITLRTNDGSTVNATLQIPAGGVGVKFDTDTVEISSVETSVQFHATSESSSRNDTVLQIVVDGAVLASFNLTAISNPEIWFKGRFEARFATDSDPYNESRGALGWTWALEGEPDFVPADSVADSIDKFVGRVIRFNNPVALRSHVPPVSVQVISIVGIVGANTEEFVLGDPIIGQPVNLGPGSYFAGNDPRKPFDPPPAETYGAALEPIANFEFHIGDWFSGKSQNPGDRPIASGLPALTAIERAEYGIANFSVFNTARKALLLADYNVLSPADRAGTSSGRNLAKRIAHLGGDATAGIAAASLTLSAGYNNKEEYAGLINDEIKFNPNHSSVISFLAGFDSFSFFGKFFNFHSDELCAQTHGSVSAITSDALAPFQNGVYNIKSRDAIDFNTLSVSEMTPANIDGIIGGAGVSEFVVVSISASKRRLVISRAVVSNPADSPADWVLSSRDESFVGEFLPEASIFPRDLFYMILPPNHERNVLGNCEGAAYTPPAAVGYTRLYWDDVDDVWKLLHHAGTQGANGVTYQGQWAGSPATIPSSCTPIDIELLTPNINFGSVEQGMTMYRQIVLRNWADSNVDVSLPNVMPTPFGSSGDTQITLPANGYGYLIVSFTADSLGLSGPTPITLTSNPVSVDLIVNLTGTSIPVSIVDTVLVLDRSGSMSEPAIQGFRFTSKATLRDRAAQLFVDLLRPGDKIGIVRYNQDAQPHMALAVAGPEISGPGRLGATAALLSPDLNPNGWTSIGDGMQEGNTMLSVPTTAVRKAMVVLTDGKENRDIRINDVILAADVSAYAVGLGLPQNINVEKLSAVTNNTGGYLLVTGGFDQDNEYRLEKYYAQILAGIAGDSIITDPTGKITPGETQRIPFYLSEADSHFDAILITHFPVLRFTLEAPDGTIIDLDNVDHYGGKFVYGKVARYYRMQMPVFASDLARAFGKWQILVHYPGDRKFTVGSDVRLEGLKARPTEKEQRQFVAATFDASRSYTVLVRARSSIDLKVGIEQTSFAPGKVRTLVAYITAFSLPLEQHTKLVAEITRPDGVVFRLTMGHQGNGRYEAVLNDNQLRGLYNIVVRVAGRTREDRPFQREQTVSGIVRDPASNSDSDARIQEVRDILNAQEELLAKLWKTIDNFISKFLTRLMPIGLLLLFLLLLQVIWMLLH